MAKVLILSASPLSQGGMETFILSLVGALRDRHDFQVYSSGDDVFFGALAGQGIRHTFWSVKGFTDWRARRALAQFLDVVEQQVTSSK